MTDLASKPVVLKAVLSGTSPSHTQLIAGVRAAFASVFSPAVDLHILFLPAQEAARLERVCPPFCSNERISG